MVDANERHPLETTKPFSMLDHRDRSAIQRVDLEGIEGRTGH
jgi:hypothetical protein